MRFAGRIYDISPDGQRFLMIKAVGAEHAPSMVIVVALPRRFLQLTGPFNARFGAGFKSRCEQAVRSYNGQAYLAACAMCGAASESIMLAIASERKPAEDVLVLYAGSQGRSRLKKLLLHDGKAHVIERFDRHFALLSYWRDDAAHGKDSALDEPDAFTALLALVRLAQFANDEFPRGSA